MHTYLHTYIIISFHELVSYYFTLVIFLAPVLSVYFVTRNISLVSPDVEEDLLSSELTVVQGVPVSLRCVSVGGYPPPDVYIRAGDRDVTDQFSSVQSPTMVGEKGLRLLQYRIERWTDGLRLSADDDGTVYRCLSVVSDVGSLLAAVKVYVNCEFLSANTTSLLVHVDGVCGDVYDRS